MRIQDHLTGKTVIPPVLSNRSRSKMLLVGTQIGKLAFPTTEDLLDIYKLSLMYENATK